ncbi:MAG: hypothetical protein AB1486_22660 [Planctomycetota bacterium]
MSQTGGALQSEGARRAIYAGVLLALALPFFIPWHLASFVSPETESLFETIERLAAERDSRIVLLMSDWGPGTKGENEPQFLALARHLLARRLPVAVLTVMSDPVGMYYAHNRLVALVAEANARLAEGERPLRYGEDWINLGMKTKGERVGDSVIPILQAFCHDIHAFTVQDINGETLGRFPIMQRLRTIADVSLVIEVSAGELETLDWLSAIQPRHPGLGVALATMSIVATKMLPYFKSGQLAGFLDGSRGADEYNELLHRAILPRERLFDPEKDRRKNALSTGRMFVVAMIVLGNCLYFARRRRPG